MKNAYIVEALRTPFGSYGGSLADVHVTDLGATVIKGLVEKTGIDVDAI
ncbi:MAG: acetyl-CoA C-acetyltransferase, partial [Deferribacterales bacterium]|nr:acetyl-CoA C-acetyltransferase [Deferribacterales bacterium]